MPDNAIYKLVRRLLLSSQLTTVNCEETDWHSCGLDTDTWGHRGVLPVVFL